jgi:hypothetical protein
MKNDIKKILFDVSCASSEGEILIGVNKIENLYAPIIKSLKESNDLVYNLQQELLKKSNELLEIKETANLYVSRLQRKDTRSEKTLNNLKNLIQ